MVQAKTGSEVKKYYQRRYQKEQLAAMRPAEAYSDFVKYFTLGKNKKILDIGCGTGYFLKSAVEKGLLGYGIDFSPQAVRIARTVSSRAKFFCASVEKMPFKNNFFDALICLGGLQYFPQMGLALKEMVRVTKAKATFVFMMPNRNFILWRLFGKNKKVLWGIEENILSLADWRKLLEKHGFRIEKIEKDHWYAHKNLFLKILWPFVPLGLTYQFIFVCRRMTSD